MTLFRRSVLLNQNFRWFDELASDFQIEPDSTFPQVILIEPAYDDDPFALHPDDNHPPLPMGPGEVFLSRVYKAVTSNPQRWARTVLLIYYDEHGGFFDHLPPLPVHTPAPNAEYPEFQTTGPRIPAIVVSPLVRPAPFARTISITLLCFASWRRNLRQERSTLMRLQRVTTTEL